MSHSLCALIHFLAAHQLAGQTIGGFARIPAELAGDIPEAVRLELLETKGSQNTLDYFWARLTEPGIEVAGEGLCAMEAAS